MQKSLRDIVLEFLTIVNYPNNKETFVTEFEQINHLETLTNIWGTLPPETQEKIKTTTSPEEAKQLLPREAYLAELTRVSGNAFAQHINDVLPYISESQKEKLKQLLLEVKGTASPPSAPPVNQPIKAAPGKPTLLYGPTGQLLRNPENITFTKEFGGDPERDFNDPRFNPDLKRLLEEVSRSTSLTISNIFANHNHWDAIDISTVNGLTVGPDNADARALVESVTRMQVLALRPARIGSPWNVGEGTFTDEHHQEHIHLQFNRNHY